jgi:outer membrane lipoprotein-sorting protein
MKSLCYGILGLLAVLWAQNLLAGPVTQPTSQPGEMDPSLRRQLEEIDVRGARIQDLAAEFVQVKNTALLRKPLTSSGYVRVKGAAVLWNVDQPQPSMMRIEGQDIQIYYPRQKRLEIYEVDRRIGDLAASPLPRLSSLLRYFQFEPSTWKDLTPTDDQATFVYLRLAPITDELRKYVAQVRIALDRSLAVATAVEMTDADGEKTLIRFMNVKINHGLQDQDLAPKIPEDTVVVRPLEKRR